MAKFNYNCSQEHSGQINDWTQDFTGVNVQLDVNRPHM